MLGMSKAPGMWTKMTVETDGMSDRAATQGEISFLQSNGQLGAANRRGPLLAVRE